MFDLPRAGGNVTFALQFFLFLKIEMYYEGLIQLGNWYLHAGLINQKRGVKTLALISIFIPFVFTCGVEQMRLILCQKSYLIYISIDLIQWLFSNSSVEFDYYQLIL